MDALHVPLFVIVVVGGVGVRSANASPNMIRLGYAGCAEWHAYVTAGARPSSCFPPLPGSRCKTNGVATPFSVRCPQVQRARPAMC